jgi:tetratricopeptide (TPR) repeat protein
LLIGLVVVASIIWNGVLLKQKEEQEIAKCLNYLEAKNYQLAKQTGENAVKLYPNNADAHRCLGEAYYYLGNSNSSIEELKTAEKLTSDKKTLGAIYSYLGGDYSNLNDFNTALLYYSRGLKISTDLNDTKNESRELNNIASIYEKMGNYDKALEYLNKSLQLTSDPSAIATIYDEVGLVYLIKGDNNKAIEYAKKAMQAGENAVKLYPNNADAHQCLGEAYYYLGDFSSSIEELKTAEKLTSDKKTLAAIYSYLGGDYLNLNDFNTALLYYSRGLKISTDLNDTKNESRELNNIASIYEKMGNYDKALEYLNKSLQLTSELYGVATIYNNIGVIYTAKGDNNKAIEYAKKAIEIFQENGNSSGTAQSMINIALSYINLGNFSKAEYYLTQGLDMVKKLGDKKWEAYAYAVFGQLYSAQNQEALAKEYFTKSYDLFKSIGNNSEAQNIYETFLKQ